VQPPPSARDLLYTREIQLQEEEAARRRSLGAGQMSEQEINAILEAEFREQKRQLLCELEALPHQS
jgi:hypothetical protein